MIRLRLYTSPAGTRYLHLEGQEGPHLWRCLAMVWWCGYWINKSIDTSR